MRVMEGWFIKGFVAISALMVGADAILIRLDANEGIFAVGFIGACFVGVVLTIHWRDAARRHP